MTLLSKPADGKGFSGSKDNGATNYHSIEQGSISHGEEVGNEGTVDWQYQKKSPYFRIVSAFVLIAGSAFALRNGTAPTGLSSGELVKASTASALERCPAAPQQDPGIESDVRPVLPNHVGSNFASQFTRTDLFRGYKVSDQNNPMKPYIFKDPDQNQALRYEKISQNFNKQQIIQTREDVNKVLGISGELSVSYGPVSGRGSGDYLDRQISSKTKIIVTVVDRTAFFQIRVANNGNLEYTDSFQELYDKGDMNVIYDRYGTYMTNAVQYGCSLYARYEITSETEIDSTEINAEVVGSIGVGVLKGNIKGKFEANEGSERAQYRMSITGIIQGVDINFPNLNGLDGFDAANEIINTYNEAKDAMREEADGIDDIEELTGTFSPSAITLDSIDTFVSILDMDPNAAFWLNEQARATGDVLQQSYLDDHRLEAERVRLLAKYPGGIDYRRIYVPFYSAQQTLGTVVKDKIDECLKYMLKPAREILCDEKRAPNPLSIEYLIRIVGLLGGGVIFEPWGSDSLLYEGYTVFNEETKEDESFYKGRLLCNDDESIDQIGEARVRELKKFVENNPNPICYETASPSESPTSNPTYSPSESPTRTTPPPTAAPTRRPIQPTPHPVGPGPPTPPGFSYFGLRDDCFPAVVPTYGSEYRVSLSYTNLEECSRRCIFGSKSNIAAVQFTAQKGLKHGQCVCNYAWPGSKPNIINIPGDYHCYKYDKWPDTRAGGGHL